MILRCSTLGISMLLSGTSISRRLRAKKFNHPKQSPRFPMRNGSRTRAHLRKRRKRKSETTSLPIRRNPRPRPRLRTKKTTTPRKTIMKTLSLPTTTTTTSLWKWWTGGRNSCFRKSILSLKQLLARGRRS